MKKRLFGHNARAVAFVVCAFVLGVLVWRVGGAAQQTPDATTSTAQQEDVQPADDSTSEESQDTSGANDGSSAVAPDLANADPADADVANADSEDVDLNDTESEEDPTLSDDATDDDVEDGGVSQVFMMPEDVEYEPQVAVFTVNPGISAAQVNDALSSLEGVEPTQVSEQDIASGAIRVPLKQGTSVEDGVNELLSTDVVSVAQPNYVYRVSDLIDAVDEQGDQAPAPTALDVGDVGQEAAGSSAESEPVESSVRDDSQQEVYDEAPSVQDGPDDEADQTASAPNAAAPTDSQTEEDDTARLEDEEDESINPTDADKDDQLAAESVSAESGDANAKPSTVDAEATKVNVNDPYASMQWGLSSIQTPEAWALRKVSGSVTVAVLDVGFDLSHPDLKENLLPAYNAATNNSIIPRPDAANYAHGTHVLGIIGAVANNRVGVTGATYNAKMLPIMLAEWSGEEWIATTDSLNRGYQYAVDNSSALGVRVINMSVGSATFKYEEALAKKIKDAYNYKNIVTVASAGNIDSGETPTYHFPSDIDECVAVMNLQQTTYGVRRSDTSNYNRNASDTKDICAPGTSILSTYPGGAYQNSSGSSMATPFVSSILALEFAEKPTLTAKEAVSILYASAIDLGSSGWDVNYGWGEANAYTAVYGARNGVNAGRQRAVEERERRLQQEKQAAIDDKASKSLRYRAYSQKKGWQAWKSGGSTAGYAGKSLRMEGLRMALSNAPYSGGIRYRVYVQGKGWQGWKANGATAGAAGKGRRTEAVRVELTGAMAEHYDVWYRVYAQKFGWMGWTKNGAKAGSISYDRRLEAVQVRIVPKGGNAPGSTSKPYAYHKVACRARVQKLGWRAAVYDGTKAGTTGRGLRLEALRISLPDRAYSGGIRYRVYVQGKGWQGWKANGATAGAAGKGRRTEAVRVELTGAMAEHYDVWYRVYAQKFGWMGWTKNGAKAGSVGYKRRIEAVQVKLVAKGGKAPGKTARAYKQR